MTTYRPAHPPILASGDYRLGWRDGWDWEKAAETGDTIPVPSFGADVSEDYERGFAHGRNERRAYVTHEG